MEPGQTRILALVAVGANKPPIQQRVPGFLPNDGLALHARLRYPQRGPPHPLEVRHEVSKQHSGPWHCHSAERRDIVKYRMNGRIYWLSTQGWLAPKEGVGWRRMADDEAEQLVFDLFLRDRTVVSAAD